MNRLIRRQFWCKTNDTAITQNKETLKNLYTSKQQQIVLLDNYLNEIRFPRSSLYDDIESKFGIRYLVARELEREAKEKQK